MDGRAIYGKHHTLALFPHYIDTNRLPIRYTTARVISNALKFFCSSCAMDSHALGTHVQVQSTELAVRAERRGAVKLSNRPLSTRTYGAAYASLAQACTPSYIVGRAAGRPDTASSGLSLSASVHLIKCTAYTRTIPQG
jgi:hypothetical protein